MSLIDSAVKIAQQEVGVSRHVPITHMNAPTVMESQQGGIFSVLKLTGVPFDTQKTDVINRYKNQWHRALMALDERFCVLGTLHRKKIQSDLQGTFTNDFARSVDQAYREQFKNTPLYVNELYLAVIYKGLMARSSGGLSRLFQHVNGTYIKAARDRRRTDQMKHLHEAVFQLSTSLSEFSPRLLGEQDDSLGYSELLSYLSLLVNGGEPLQFKSMEYSPSVQHTLDKARSAATLYPRGNLSQYVSAKRLFFGDYIQFQGALPNDVRYGAMVSVKRYGASSASIMLDPLLHLQGEFISTNSFMMVSKTQADKRMSRHANKMQNANDPAVSQIDALANARDQLASDQIAMGYHHNTVLLLSDSLEALDQQIADTIKAYMDAGLVAVRETLGQEAAFWAQIPTNFKYIARSSLIGSQNFVDFFPLHNYRTGYRDDNHLGSALTLIETPSKTPLWLNLHARGPKDNPSPGHTTLIGGNGSGKTVAMCFLDAQLNRYGGRSFFFDRNRGTEIYIRASGGCYQVLSPDHAHEIAFNPFQLNDTPSHRQFCKAWLVQLIRKEGEQEVDEVIVDQLSQCVDYAYEQLAPAHRNLCNATKMLPVTFARWIRLRRWLRGDHQRPDGEYAYLFDHDHDALTLSDKTGFDMTYFLDHEPPAVLVAITMYLFHRLELSLQGELVSVFLDEAWQYLDNAYWQEKLKKWLPTLRKLNCHIVFATQSPKSVVTSSISHTLLDNCATQLYFPNPQAKEVHYIQGFNLTESEFACIRENEPQSRLLLYKQGHVSSLGTLNLSPLKDLLNILSGTKKTVDMLTEIRAKVGDDPNDWLPIFLERCAR